LAGRAVRGHLPASARTLDGLFVTELATKQSSASTTEPSSHSIPTLALAKLVSRVARLLTKRPAERRPGI